MIEIALGFALQDGGAARSLAAEAVYTHAGMLLHADALDQAAELLHAERTKAAPDSTDDSVGVGSTLRSVHALRAALAEFAVHDADEDGVLDADEWRELVQVAARRRRTPCASQAGSQSVRYAVLPRQGRRGAVSPSAACSRLAGLEVHGGGTALARLCSLQAHWGGGALLVRARATVSFERFSNGKADGPRKG